jgi:hypothetical protein
MLWLAILIGVFYLIRNVRRSKKKIAAYQEKMGKGKI